MYPAACRLQQASASSLTQAPGSLPKHTKMAHKPRPLSCLDLYQSISSAHSLPGYPDQHGAFSQGPRLPLLGPLGSNSQKCIFLHVPQSPLPSGREGFHGQTNLGSITDKLSIAEALGRSAVPPPNDWSQTWGEQGVHNTS